MEAETGYEFHYSPSNVSVAELAEWVVAKCCPFFDSHIDLEREGPLGGLVTSTIFILLVLPTIYPWFVRRAEKQTDV